MCYQAADREAGHHFLQNRRNSPIRATANEAIRWHKANEAGLG